MKLMKYFLFTLIIPSFGCAELVTGLILAQKDFELTENEKKILNTLHRPVPNSCNEIGKITATSYRPQKRLGKDVPSRVEMSKKNSDRSLASAALKNNADWISDFEFVEPDWNWENHRTVSVRTWKCN